MASLSAREQAYQTIRSRIITMELKPGDELNDRELAQELGISRTPMREALIMLNIAHMVVIKPQSGTHVAPIDLKLMEMEQFARFTLEKEMLNRIRGTLTPEQEEAAAGYADNFGFAFQLRDDMLDVIGDEKTFGKPIGSDKEEGKITYVDVDGLEGCARAVEACTRKAKDAVAQWPDHDFLFALADQLVDRNK